MSSLDEPERGPDLTRLVGDLDRKLDTIAGALAAVASSHRELLREVQAAEDRRTEDALDVAQRLDALERQVLDLRPAPPGSTASTPQATVQEDLGLVLDVLSRLATSVEVAEARTEDRLAAIRDAATGPVTDLQELLTARSARTDERLDQLAEALQRLADRAAPAVLAPQPPVPDATERISARLRADVGELVAELAEAVQALSWQLPEVRDALTELRAQVAAVDVAGPVAEVADDLGERLSDHTDRALIAVLRLFDTRLASVHGAIEQVAAAPAVQQPPAAGMGFEAGAVMGAAQATWNRLEQRLDTEFADLGRQLRVMEGLVEQALATAEAAAHRPLVTGDQVRKTASSVKEAVLGASRSRRDRHGRPPGLGPGPS